MTNKIPTYMLYNIMKKYICIDERNNHDVDNDLLGATNYLNMVIAEYIWKAKLARVPDVPGITTTTTSQTFYWV
jgi:hypothetical protein